MSLVRRYVSIFVLNYKYVFLTDIVISFPYLVPQFFSSTGMAGVPGTANAIFGAVKDVGANVIMISQVIRYNLFFFDFNLDFVV